MHINVSTIRSHYPEWLGIRKNLQRLKVRRITRFTLSAEEISLCESDESKKKEVITPYLKKWDKYLQPCCEELQDMIAHASFFQECNDTERIITDILFCRLAYGFIPSEYIGFCLYEKSPEERKEYCSDLYTNVFGYTVNNIVQVQTVLNKATSARKYQQLFKRDFMIVDKTTDYAEFCLFVEKHPSFVKKKTFSSMGQGVELVSISNDKKRDFFNSLLTDDQWLIEEKVVQRPEMACFNESSVNTIRCITFKTNQGIVVPYCFMRTGRKGAFVDNGGSGGLLIGIDIEKGMLITNAYDEYGIVYSIHPDSGVQFKGYRIPEWNKMLEICKNAAEKETQMGYLSWDMAYTNRGWCVIEVNEVGQFIGPQIVFKKGIKAELVQYLSIMQRVI